MPRLHRLRLIVFFGPDGSGKTTQSRLVASNLKEQGFRVRFVWIRAHHSLASVLSKILVCFGYCRPNNAQANNYKLFDINLVPRLKRFWELIEFVSVIPWILLKVKLPLLLGFVVVADRYLIDTIVSVAYFVEDDEYLSGYTARILLGMAQKNAFLIHLDAETSVILKRRKDEQLDLDFVAFQKKLYMHFADALGVLTIDTSNKNPKETCKIILNTYSSHLQSTEPVLASLRDRSTGNIRQDLLHIHSYSRAQIVCLLNILYEPLPSCDEL